MADAFSPDGWVPSNVPPLNTPIVPKAVADVMAGVQIKSDGGATSYYELPEGAKDLNDLIEHKGMGFGLGNIFKACFRLGEKEGTDPLYDINKIVYFGLRLKKFYEKNGRLP